VGRDQKSEIGGQKLGINARLEAVAACKNFYLDAGATFVSMSGNLALQKIAPLIHEIRGERIILDADLARIYGVTTKRLNEQVKRNADRFPDDFAFELSKEEWGTLRSQSVTSKSNRSQIATSSSASLTNRSQFATGPQKHRDPRYPPHAFTEHGAIMAANVLNSKQAVQMSVFVVRAFVKLREVIGTHKELADKLIELERKLGTHDKAIVPIIAAIRGLTEPTKRKVRAIGFRARRESLTDTNQSNLFDARARSSEQRQKAEVRRQRSEARVRA